MGDISLLCIPGIADLISNLQILVECLIIGSFLKLTSFFVKTAFLGIAERILLSWVLLFMIDKVLLLTVVFLGSNGDI